MTTEDPEKIADIETFFRDMGLDDASERDRFERLSDLGKNMKPAAQQIVLVEPSDRTDAVSIESSGGGYAKLEQDP